MKEQQNHIFSTSTLIIFAIKKTIKLLKVDDIE